jgi:hypothetical protein
MSMNGQLKLATDAQIDELLAQPETVRAFLFGEPETFEDRSDLDLDKAWDGLHFLLTGADDEARPPLDFLVTGGEEIGDEEVGYGPARAYRSSQVREIAAALAPLSPDVLIERFDPAGMAAHGIYPEIIWEREEEHDDQREWLRDSYAALRDLVLGAARDGLGLIVYII